MPSEKEIKAAEFAITDAMLTTELSPRKLAVAALSAAEKERGNVIEELRKWINTREGTVGVFSPDYRVALNDLRSFLDSLPAQASEDEEQTGISAP